MRFHRRRRPVEVPPSGFAGFRFPAEVIVLAVRWYLRSGLSYRDQEELLLAERGVEVDHVTLYRWVQRFTPRLIDAARPCRHDAGDRWCVDETYVRVAGVWEVPVCAPRGAVGPRGGERTPPADPRSGPLKLRAARPWRRREGWAQP
jgi:hypothetical protein